MRFRFACAIAMTLPIPMERTASTTSMSCQSPCRPHRPSERSRTAIAKAASLGAVPTNMVTGVSAPSYTSGIHMWNGAARA